MSKRDHKSGVKGGSSKNAAHLKVYIEAYREVFESLSDLEKEFIKLMSMGEKQIDILPKLHISEAEFKGFKTTLFQKLALETESDYIKCALAFGLISF